MTPFGVDTEHFDRFKTAEELLPFYRKRYGVKKFESKIDNTLVRCRALP